MPSLEASVQLFLAGFASWTVGIFSGGGGSQVLLAVVTHVIRVRMVAPVEQTAWRRTVAPDQ